MARAYSKGSGWHGQTSRHRSARMTGRAGGTYMSAKEFFSDKQKSYNLYDADEGKAFGAKNKKESRKKSKSERTVDDE